MRLGVDGRILSARPTGIATYALEMIKALGGLGVELFVYTSAMGEACLNGSDATTRAVLPDRRYLRGSKAQLGLGRHLGRDRIDAFWCPTHRLPFFLPRNIPSLVTVHDLVWRKYPRTMRVTGRLADRLLAPHAISNATRLIALSRSTASDLAAFDRSADAKIAVIPPGVSNPPGPAHPDPRAVLANLGIEKPFVLFVGTSEPRKNIGRLIEAFSRLGPELRESHVLVICGGGGWGGVDPRTIAFEQGVESSVIVTGYVDDTTLRALYSNAVCLALPSLYEGFGLPILDARAAGLPILTSNVASMPEAAGKAGLLVDPRSVESIADGLRRLLASPEVRHELASHARVGLDLYCWKAGAAALLKLAQTSVAAK